MKEEEKMVRIWEMKFGDKAKAKRVAQRLIGRGEVVERRGSIVRIALETPHRPWAILGTAPVEGPYAVKDLRNWFALQGSLFQY